MIGTEFIKGQGLGNQLFCYVTARAIAEENGYEFGTAGQERFAVNIHSDKDLAAAFMQMSMGDEPEEIAEEKPYPEKRRRERDRRGRRDRREDERRDGARRDSATHRHT